MPSVPVLQSAQKPVVIGVYGIPGSGKSFLLRQLQQELDHDSFAFYEGSQMIGDLVPGGLDAFQTLNPQEKAQWRGRAIDKIRDDSTLSGKTAIVAGHLMFWKEGQQASETVHTENDLRTFTHILYLFVDPREIARRRLTDESRSRDSTSLEHLRIWQEAEMAGLQRLCRNYGILFFRQYERDSGLAQRVSTLFSHFRQEPTETNSSNIQRRLDEIFPDTGCLDTVIVLDGDKTLAAQDTGCLFWKKYHGFEHNARDLKELFSGPLGYSEFAFRQATLLYEELVQDDADFDAKCQVVADSVQMYREFVKLLGLVATEKHMGAIVVTCGLGRVWEMVLEAQGLSDTVKVIGGGRVSDKFVVTPEEKASIVSRLRNTDGLHVVAFGDSPLDLPMLKEASKAFVVVGEEKDRSRSMDAALHRCISRGQLEARQILLPSHVTPRLNYNLIPQVRFSDETFIHSVTRCRRSGFQDPALSSVVLHATAKNAAKVLMSPTRDASVAGPALREEHHNIGKYLAIEYLSQVLGIQEYMIPHVQGHQTKGFKIRNEDKTSIVALMRGGEPLALGVNDVLREAMFIHAASPSDVKSHHVEDQRAIILVDSVVNSGDTIIQFVARVRDLHATIQIVVVALVVQVEATSEDHRLHILLRHVGARLVALRLSENRFTGTRSTDTGNRLFNTTHLD